MKLSVISIKNIKFLKTRVDIEEIKKYESEEEFMTLGVELLKEVGIISSVLGCSFALDENNNPRKWTRNEAILAGLMIRLTKLQQALLDQTCQKRREIVEIIFRCLMETIINLHFLLENNSEKMFDKYIEYSLREEKRLLQRINQNVNERGYEIPIEKRMKDDIYRAFKTSGFKTDQVNETSYAPWGAKIFERAESLKMKGAYSAFFSLPSHAVHGNWQDLITHHIKFENGGFSPAIEWSRSRPQPLFIAALLTVITNKAYLNQIIPDCPDKSHVNQLLDDAFVKIRVADELHEQFLINRPK